MEKEEKKNIQAAAEFWAVMRHTHGFQNQAASPQIQAVPANDVAPSTETETPSRQPAEALLESQGNNPVLKIRPELAAFHHNTPVLIGFFRGEKEQNLRIRGLTAVPPHVATLNGSAGLSSAEELGTQWT